MLGYPILGTRLVLNFLKSMPSAENILDSRNGAATGSQMVVGDESGFGVVVDVI